MAELIVKNTDRKVFVDIQQETISGFQFLLTSTQNIADAVEGLDDKIVTVSRYLDGKKVRDEFTLSLYDIINISYANKPMLYEQHFGVKLSFLANTNSFMFNLGTNIVLKNGEYFRLECTNTGLFDGVDFSYSVRTLASIGLQSHVPVFEIFELDTLLKTHTLNLGNDVLSIVLSQKELRNAITPALKCPVKKLDVKSDKLVSEFLKEYIYTSQTDYDGAPNHYGYPIALLATSKLLNNLKIILEFDNASANRRLIVCRAVQTPEIVNNFQKKTMEHQAENIAHVKNNDGMCGCNH